MPKPPRRQGRAAIAAAVADLRQFLAGAASVIGAAAAEAILDNFDAEGLRGQYDWEPRRHSTRAQRGRKVLQGRRVLYRSIGYQVAAGGRRVEAGTTGRVTPYAEIHNEGGEITVTAKMRAFFWAKYYETAEALHKAKRKDGSVSIGSQRARQLRGDAGFWRAMALKPVGSKIVMPRRAFAEITPQMERAIERALAAHLRPFLDD